MQSPPQLERSKAARGGANDCPVSIIIPHRDTPEALARCLEALQIQSADIGYEVIVVDSSYERPDWVERFSRTRLLIDSPGGPGPARNAGAAVARGDILAFIDADCQVAQDWLSALWEAFTSAPDVGAVAGRVDVAPPRSGNWTPSSVFESVFAFQQERNVRRHGVAATANFAVCAATFARVGDFAGVDFLEDYEWCKRAGREGVRLVYDDRIRVLHDSRETYRALAGKWRRHVHQEFMSHRKAGRSRVSFAAKALSIVALTPILTGYLMIQSRHHLSDRLSAVPVLWWIRALRSLEMTRKLVDPKRPRPPWNAY